MGEAFWAAREGDALLHSSLLADTLGAALEIGAVLAVGFLCGCGVGFAVGLLLAVTPLGPMLSEAIDGIANWIFPPTIQGHISKGSPDTRTNNKPAARAAGVAPSSMALKAAEAQAELEKAAAEAAEKAASDAFWNQPVVDIAGHYFEQALSSALPGVAVAKAAMQLSEAAQSLSTAEGRDAALDGTKEFLSQMWQPTVAKPVDGSEPRDQDKVDCEKHPASFSAMANNIMSDPLGTLMSGGSTIGLGVIGIACQAVSVLIKSTQSDEDAAEYLAEGARDVRINNQPAARSNARTTCEAKVVEEPSNGQHVSPDVRIGGPLVTVREIKSGKLQIALVADIAMAFMGRGRFVGKLACYFAGTGFSLVLQKAVQAGPWPIDAASGAKYLGDENDLDFTLSAYYPLSWQRVYNSRDERTEGLFGAGWSVELEVALENTPGAASEDYQTYIDASGRRLEMDPVAPGTGFHCPSSGLAARRSTNGQWMISSDDGIHRLFEADPHRPGRQRLCQMGDRHYHTWQLHYDASGRLVGLTDNAQRHRLSLHYGYPQHPRRLSHITHQHTTSEDTLLVGYRYDKYGNLSEVVNPQNHVLREFAYDANRCMTMHRLPQGRRCHYRWQWFVGPDDAAWRVVEHWTDGGEHYHLDYQLLHRALTVTDSLGRKLHRRWNAQGQITRYQDEAGHITTFDWNEERMLLGMTDPQGGKWRYIYDKNGNLAETHDPLGRVEQTLWHPLWNEPVLETDAAGNTWRHEYNEQGDRILSLDPLKQSTHYQYDFHGQLTTLTNPRGGQNHLRWNEDGQLIRYTDCSGQYSAYFYDERQRLAHQTDAAGNSTYYRYNAAGQLDGLAHPDGRQELFQVSPAGQLLAHTNPAGHITHYQHNSRGQVTQRIDAAGRQVRFHYDAYARLTALENENQESYHFQYDAKDRLIEQTDLDGRRQQLRYDALDQVIAVHFAAGTPDQITHQFQHDAVGRLIRKTTDDGHTTYHYDEADQLLDIAFSRRGLPEDAEPERIQFSYDALGQLLSETTGQGMLQHEYDALGNRLRTTLPNGRIIDQLYYGSGHLHQINLDGRTISDFERDTLHRETHRSQGALNTRTRYDNCGRLIQKQLNQHHQNPALQALLIDKQYLFDNLGQLVTKKHSRQEQTDYRYDPTGHMLGCTNVRYWDTLQYDAAANLLNTRHHSKSETSETIRFNRLLSYRKHRYEYDAHGRTQTKESKGPTQHYSYNAEHRLTQVRFSYPNNQSPGDETRYGYVYDALGRRIEKHQIDHNGQPFNRTRFLWDGMRMVQETAPSGLNSLYIYVDQNSYEPLARLDHASGEEQLYYYHTDLNGAPEELSTNDGTVVWEGSYQMWGKILHENSGDKIQQNLRYQGQYFDRETSLHYNTFRYYDPDIGRFTTQDPIGLAGGLNLYQYAPNALSWVDPLGLECVGKGSGGKGLGANQAVSRAAAELDMAAQRARRLLDRGGHMNTPWGKLHQRWSNNSLIPQSLKNMSRGNAIQQMTDKLTKGNRYLSDISVIRNKTGRWWGRLRPDYHAELSSGKVAVFDITTPGQATKITKYNVDGVTDYLINIIY